MRRATIKSLDKHGNPINITGKVYTLMLGDKPRHFMVNDVDGGLTDCATGMLIIDRKSMGARIHVRLLRTEAIPRDRALQIALEDAVRLTGIKNVRQQFTGLPILNEEWVIK